MADLKRFLCLACLCWPSLLPAGEIDECVVFVHGLARSAASMENMAVAFEQRGYAIANIDYPSRKHPVETLAPMVVESGLLACPKDSTVHFVTHSLGGILVRYYLEHNDLDRLGRVVMLAPPNQGSEVVDDFRKVPGFGALNGPAGEQLGTDAGGIVASLGAVDFELGVIAGTRTINPILSQSLPNPDDGKVSVASTKIDGMSDFIAVPHSHPFIMKAPQVIDQTAHFISEGSFRRDPPDDLPDGL